MSALALPRLARPALAAIAPGGRSLVIAGLAVAAMVPPTLLGIALDPRPIDIGHVAAESVWLKPLKFQLAIAMHLVTVGLAMAALEEGRRGDRLSRALIATLIGANLFEVVYITGRGALGLPSHFATDPVGMVLYPFMGIGATAIVVVTAIIGARVLIAPRPAGMPCHLHLAVGLGLVISGLGGLVSGISISAAGGPIIGTAGTGEVPLFGWSFTGGDLRVSHFFGIHAAQVLPLAALLLRDVRPRLARSAVWAGAFLLTALFAFTYVQALAGHPFIAL